MLSLGNRFKLSYEEELELSDRLVARRSVLNSVAEEGRELTPAEARVVREGEKARAELVEAYLPYIRSIAAVFYRKVSNGTGRAPTGISFDDLEQEGVLQAMLVANSFNARGKDGPNPGLRFANYSNRHISRGISRYLLQMSTPLSAAVDSIKASIKLEEARIEFRDTHNREPSARELEEIVGNIDALTTPIQARSKSPDVDDDYVQRGIAGSSQEIRDGSFDVQCVGTLSVLLQKNFSNPNTELIVSSYLGTDRGQARTDAEVKEHIGAQVEMGIRAIKGEIEIIQHALIHPRYRGRMKRDLRENFPDLYVMLTEAS